MGFDNEKKIENDATQAERAVDVHRRRGFVGREFHARRTISGSG